MLMRRYINSANSRLIFNIYFKRTLTNQVNKHYDIVIAGGGMVGTSLACSLGKNTKLKEKKVLLLEASGSKNFNINGKYSNRVVSINKCSKELLKQIGGWKHIEQSRFSAVRQLQVSDALSDAFITFGENDIISYIVENDLIVKAVSEEVKQYENVNVLYNAKVLEYTLPDYESNIVSIKLDNGDCYTCDLLLGCDGVNSAVRRAMQSDYISWSYHQMGVVATLKLSDKITNDIAWQRFLPKGPVAMLPLTDEFSSLIWSTTPEEAKRLITISEEEFVNELNMALHCKHPSSILIQQATSLFDTALRMLNCSSVERKQSPPKIEGIEPNSRACFPLGFGHSSQYIGKGVALLGDAAHRVHPLAGLGVNLGFGDVTCLNEVLGDAVYAGSTLNDINYLKNYETNRQRHNIVTMAAIEGLHRIYNTDLGPVVLLRSLGLQTTQALEPLKKMIMSHASL